MLNAHEISRLGADLPGYTLLTSYEAALPAFECRLDVRVLGKQDLSAIDHAVLAAVAVGIKWSRAIALLYGLEDDLVNTSLSSLMSFDLLTIDQRSSAFTATEIGLKAYEQASFRRPEIVAIRVFYDGLLGTLSSVSRELYRPIGEAIKRGLHLVPSKFDEPVLADVSRKEVAEVLREFRKGRTENGEESTGDLLDVIGLNRVTQLVLPCDIAAFEPPDHSHLAFRVVERGRRLLDHETILRGLVEKEPRVLPIQRVDERDLITDEPTFLRPEVLQEIDQREREVNELQHILNTTPVETGKVADVSSETPAAPPRRTKEELAAVKKRLEELEREVAETGTRRVQNSEHRLLLLQAFREAKKRIIIISPWLAPAAMNPELFEAMRKALSKGVEIVIGWGMPDREDDERAGKKRDDNRRLLFQLEKLQKEIKSQAAGAERVIKGDPNLRPKKKQGLLRIVRLGNTHEKILIVDERWSVLTSFNWLSYRGDPNRAVRNEAGYMVRSPATVRETAAEVMGRIEETEAGR